MRVLSLLCATFLLFCAAPGEAAGVSATETPEGVCLRNERLVLTLGKDTKGAIRSLRDVATDTEFIATPASAALFGLAFSTAGQPTAPLTRVSGAEAARFAVACEATGKGQTVVLTYENLRQTGVNVVCRASAAPGDPLIRWRLSTTFPATLVLEEATFPICALRVPLGSDPAADAVVIGSTKGGVLRAPADLKAGTGLGATQPGSPRRPVRLLLRAARRVVLRRVRRDGLPQASVVPPARLTACRAPGPRTASPPRPSTSITMSC